VISTGADRRFASWQIPSKAVPGTGWFAAFAAEAGPGKTVAVVGDGAVGLLGILAGQAARRRADHSR
jgi:D-arabinose 1-dehydrogenase-like Zn-dependent alcohol dehydrogenase